MQVSYECNPALNIECSKTNCYVNGGLCSHTIKEEYAKVPMLDGIVFEQTLHHMLEMQKSFQDRTDPRYCSSDYKERAAFIRDHFVFCDQELQEMLYEIPFFKHWKDYSKMTEEEIVEAYSKAKEELIDAWHFFMNIAIALGMSAEEFYQRYLNKHKENIRRQDEGYDHTMRHI